MVRSPWVSALLILALAVRGLIPDGYMPDDPGRDGGAVLKLCHSVGGQHAISLADLGLPVERDGTSDSDQHSSCPFSALPAGAPLPAPAVMPTAVTPASTAIRLAIVSPRLSQTRPALPPRGPPDLLR
jgi:hypothetical protein